jgi:hypothetical protein
VTDDLLVFIRRASVTTRFSAGVVVREVLMTFWKEVARHDQIQAGLVVNDDLLVLKEQAARHDEHESCTGCDGRPGSFMKLGVSNDQAGSRTGFFWSW